jgi:outer membrane immunogenic protein
MRSFILAIGLLSGLSTIPAVAADMPVKAPARTPVEVAYNWTGFYIGAHVGGVWGNKDLNRVSLPGIPNAPEPFGSHDVSGVIGGGQIGFNWQTGRLVLGIEAQVSWTNADGEHVIQPAQDTRARTELNWFGTAAVRVGYTWDRALIYLKGGAAWIDEDYFLSQVQTGELLATASETRWGWMVGAGVELALSGNWSAKLEYNYMDFGNELRDFTFTPALGGTFCCGVNIEQHLHVVKFGINYRFAAGAPVVARY